MTDKHVIHSIQVSQLKEAIMELTAHVKEMADNHTKALQALEEYHERRHLASERLRRELELQYRDQEEKIERLRRELELSRGWLSGWF